MVFLLLGAGSETTAHLISGSAFELLKTPALRDWLEQDWSRANLAVEEFLRFVSPVQFTKPRYVRKDVTLDGVALKKGDTIMVMIGAANIDPKANDAPEKLDLERHPNRHIAFGTGIHFCLGYQLARMEGKCALQALFTRWPKLALAIPPTRSGGGRILASGPSRDCPSWPANPKAYLPSAAPCSASLSRFSSSGVSCGRSTAIVSLSSLPVKLNGTW